LKKIIEMEEEQATSTTPAPNSIALDYLGPIIINVDGTLQRIPNWDTMSESEQKKALRLVAARNKKRIQVLEEQQMQQQQSSEETNVGNDTNETTDGSTAPNGASMMAIEDSRSS
jgi:hypothetical protein